jgi:hypothetical protein
MLGALLGERVFAMMFLRVVITVALPSALGKTIAAIATIALRNAL